MRGSWPTTEEGLAVAATAPFEEEIGVPQFADTPLAMR